MSRRSVFAGSAAATQSVLGLRGEGRVRAGRVEDLAMGMAFDLVEGNARAVHQAGEQLVGRGLLLHVEAERFTPSAQDAGLGADRIAGEREAHALAEAVEELPFLDHVGARRRRDDRLRVLGVGLGIAVGDVGLLDAFARDREAGDFEGELRRDHVVRELRGRRQLQVEGDEQLELLHGGDRLALIGPGGDRIAAEADEHADALLALVEDLVREGRRRKARRGVAERSRAERFALAPAGARCRRLRFSQRRGEQCAGVRDRLARAPPAAA